MADITLLYHTPEPERSIAAAARLCYSDKTPEKLFDNLTDEEIHRLIKLLLTSNHLSAFEHASFTFGLSGLSRACTHQLVRHRLASFNQQSQRYVKHGSVVSSVVPAIIKLSDEALGVYLGAINECNRAYDKMLELGIPAEDARYVLPNATTSNIVVTMNVRELLHFFSLRCCNRAQWEIKSVAWKMLELCLDVAPNIFKFAGPECIRTKCPEGKMFCGHPYPKEAKLC